MSGLTNQQAQQSSAKTLWIGDIEPWMDESYVQKMFSNYAAVSSVKLIRDKVKNTPLGYGFVEFPNHEIAQNVYLNLNGQNISGTTRCFKLNWASHSTKDSSGAASQPINAKPAQPQDQGQIQGGGS